MAQHNEHGLLEKFQTHFKCYSCKVPPGPKARKYRYLCSENNHPLCSDCKNSCPCKSELNKSKKPCEFIAKMIEEFPWFYCCHNENGCREMLKEKEYEDHQQSCIYRSVNCPALACGDKIRVKDVSDHLSIWHPPPVIRPIIVARNEFIMTWVPDYKHYRPRLFYSQDGNQCYAICYEDKLTFFFWIYVAVSPVEAKNYECVLSLSNVSGDLTFRGKVHPLDTHFSTILSNEECLCCGYPTVQRFLTKIEDSEALRMNVKLRNIKEEVKDENVESGVSEDESDQDQTQVMNSEFGNFSVSEK